MTQKFTTPCFIRKNTKKLRKKLEELGYEPSKIIFDNEKLCIATAVNKEYAKYTNITNEMFDLTNPHETWNCTGRIDCGTNEDLFLALAALREDSDYMQFFTNGTYWYICGANCIKNSSLFDKEYKLQIKDGCDYHKATVEEIIEHFTNG